MTMEGMQVIRRKLPDISGACLSVLCTVHCILAPVLGPMLVAYSVPEPVFHVLVFAVGIPLTSFAWIRSRRQKWRGVIRMLMAAGWILFGAVELLHGHDAPYLQALAGALIAAGHALNVRKNGEENCCVR